MYLTYLYPSIKANVYSWMVTYLAYYQPWMTQGVTVHEINVVNHTHIYTDGQKLMYLLAHGITIIFEALKEESLCP